MKLLIAIAILLASLGTGVGPTFAVDPPKVPPKGIEGPNIRAHMPPKGIEGSDIRQNTMPVPRGLEGPEDR
jgi:hypothetical protein